MSATYAGRAMSPVADQMDLIKPHVTRPIATSPKRHTDQHTFILAKPPEWMAQGRCVGNYMLYDNTVGLSAGEAAARCAGCPVIEQCLAAAMVEEGSLSAAGRYGIRGGLSPRERADLAASAKECERGHFGRWGDNGHGGITCHECRAEDKRAAYVIQRQEDPGFMERRVARSREARNIHRVTCLDCKTEMRASSFPRHLAVVHSEDAAA